MRILRIVLIIMLLPLGFAGGLMLGTHLASGPAVSSGEKASAEEAARLQQHIIEELQARYYKAIDVEKLKAAGIDGMLSSLKDPYTEYLSPAEVRLLDEQTEGRYSGIGAILEKKEDKLLITGVFEGSPADKAGLKAGDHIVAVDGRATAAMSLDAAVARIKGEAGTQVTLKVEQTGGRGVRTVTLTRREIDIPITEARMLRAADGTRVGYVRLNQFSAGAGEHVRQEIDRLTAKGAAWIVFDLRDNGGGLLTEAVDVAGDFLSSGVVTTTKGLHSPKEELRVEGDEATDLPLVLLVNEYSASASEIVAGALRDYERAYLVGATTFGKGLVQNVVGLPGGAALKLTTSIYLTPKGHNIHKRGIKPDLPVKDKPKVEGDEQLDAALEYIAKQ